MPDAAAASPRSPLRLTVFASGGGSNFQSMLDAIEAGDLNAEPVLCVSDRSGARALERARTHGIPTAIVDPDAPDHASSLLDTLAAHDTTFVALAGYLRKIPSEVVDRYRHRMTNIHPALLPAFGGRGMYGMHVHRAVIDHGVRWSGATVHLVDETYDTGPIVLQEPVPVYPDDTPDTLAARVLELEHRLYPDALRLFADGRVRCDGRTVTIAPPPSP